MLKSRLISACAAVALLAGVCVPGEVKAAATTTNFGTFVGLFDGNDADSAIAAILGLSPTLVTELGKVGAVNGTNGGLILTSTTNTGGATPASGDWSTSSPIGILVVKDGTTSCTGTCIGGGDYTGSGDAFAVYSYAGATAGSWIADKFFGFAPPDSTNIQYKTASHITAYNVVPIPAALPLLLTAIGGLLGFRWFRRRKDDEVVAA